MPHYIKASVVLVGIAAAVWQLATPDPSSNTVRGIAAAYGLFTLWIVGYFYRYQQDPMDATPSMFPHVPNPDAEQVNLRTSPLLSQTEGKTLVIGAGFVGLGMAAGLQRHEIPYDHVEAEEAVAGNWRYGVYDTVHIISSKKTTEYKDFPMPKDYPDFPSVRQICSYLDAYAAHFHLNDRLVCGVLVKSCVPINGGADGWDVTLEVTALPSTNSKGRKSPEDAARAEVFANIKAEEASRRGPASPTSGFPGVKPNVVRITRRYKAVMLCLGHHWSMRLPSYPGMDKFDGSIVHSKQVKRPGTELAGKRVLVIGGGNSACDLSVEAGKVGKSAHISLRRGVWFMPRTFLGIPAIELTPPWAPMWMQRSVAKLMCRLVFGKYSNYGLPEPTTRPFDTHPTANNDLLQSIKMGRVKPKGAIDRFVKDKTVVFADGSREDFDTIICATGYNYALPMLPEGVVTYEDGVPKLYGGCVEGYRHLYISVGAQVRYGAGPLITSGAQAVGHIIKTQDQLQHPVADVLKAMGTAPMRKSPHTSDALKDPVGSWNENIAACKRMSMLVTFEKWLVRFGRLPKTPLVPLASSLKRGDSGSIRRSSSPRPANGSSSPWK